METRPVIDSYHSSRSAAEVLGSRNSRRTSNIEALQQAPNNDGNSPQREPNANSTHSTRNQRAVLTINRHDGSEVLTIYV